MKTTLGGALLPDPSVRGVERLLSGDGPKKLLRDLAAHVPVGAGATLVVIKQRVGQRAVLRIDAGASDNGRRWFVKLLRGSSGAVEGERIAVIADAAHRIGVRIPLPVAYLPRFRALVFEPVPGRPLLRCCAPHGDEDEAVDEDRSPSRREAIFVAAGRALAGLHEEVPLREPLRERAFEKEQIARAQAVLGQFRPDLLPDYDRAIFRFANDARGLPVGTPVALHGDFYPSQVLHAPADPPDMIGISIIDWDNACAGDAERDVANFEAHIELEVHKGHLARAEAGNLADSFRSGYATRRRAEDELLAWFRRGSLLRLAGLYANPAFGPVPPNPPSLCESILHAI